MLVGASYIVFQCCCPGMGAAITYLSMAILSLILGCAEIIILAGLVDSDADMAYVGLAFAILSMLMRIVGITLSSRVVCCSRVDTDWYGYSIVLAPPAAQVQGIPLPMAVPMVAAGQAPLAHPLPITGAPPMANPWPTTGAPPTVVPLQPVDTGALPVSTFQGAEEPSKPSTSSTPNF